MSVIDQPFHPFVLYEGGAKPKLANLLTLSRLFAVPLILGLLTTGHDILALEIYGFGVLTDALDGYVARTLESATAFGARLDAVVDNVFSLAILPFLLMAFPGIGSQHPIALGLLFGAPVAYLALSFAWKRKLLMYHFQSAKIGAFLLFAAWPLIWATGCSGWVVLAAIVVCASRLEQIVFMARGGLDLDAPHGFSPVHREAEPVPSSPSRADDRGTVQPVAAVPSELDWYARSPLERAPIVTAPDADRNAIGVPAGTCSAYRAIGAISGALSLSQRPDYRMTEPAATIAPNDTWFAPGKIVTIDPFGHRVQQVFSQDIAAGRAVRPSIAVTQGTLVIPEITSALQNGRLLADETVLMSDSQMSVTKIAVEPVWYLPGVASRIGTSEDRLRQALYDYSGGAYPELLSRPDLAAFLPPIGGQSVYIFGDPAKLERAETKVTCRVHDECNSSDVFGSTLCTCRPYLTFAVEEAIRQAQKGGIGVLVYNRKEGRCLGEVVKYLVYNARKRDPGGDRADAYFDHTEKVAGTKDLREQMLSGDILHWLGITRVDRWVSMSNLKSDAIRAQGIEIVEQIELPDELVPLHAHVEIEAKTASGYFHS